MVLISFALLLACSLKKNPISYFNLALVYDLKKDYKKAVDLYKIVETLDFKEKKVLFNNLAKSFLGDRNIDEAKNSSKVKVTIDQLNYASNFSRILDSNLKINKNVFHHIGVYAYHKKFLLDFISMPQTQR